MTTIYSGSYGSAPLFLDDCDGNSNSGGVLDIVCVAMGIGKIKQGSYLNFTNRTFVTFICKLSDRRSRFRR